MKRRHLVAAISASALFAFLPAVSQAIFAGTLIANADAVLDVTPASGAAETFAVTVTYLNQTGNRIRDIDIATSTSGVLNMVLSIPKNTGRIYIEVDTIDMLHVRVMQGPNIITRDLTGDGRVVFDVAPAP